ncbi:MAG: hypothetical protein LBJ00_12650 [Planctomycetaceae bacterium]|nr:hypothetical protein [Planctomycetaceae bacterium]
MKLVIFVFAFGLAADEVQYKLGGTTVLEVFPKEIKIGDTLYCVIKATNDTDVAMYKRDSTQWGSLSRGAFFMGRL